ncbi:MAG: glycerol-3-phosphate dehydrogenase, partial [Pseudomonadota bacterium]
NAQKRIRLVRGSHIVVNKLHDHDRAYIFQQSDGRIVFAIPYETDFTLIGTTDVDHEADAGTATCTPEEAAYLCEAVSEYFDKPVTTEDIVWTYSGVRPLYDDGASSATAATRDYVLEVDAPDNTAPALSVFGGKITTYRRLSEEVCGKLAPFFPSMGDGWTAGKPLPGGDFAVDGVDALVVDLSRRYGFLENRQAKRLVRAYGTQAAEMLGDAKDASDLGTDFGAGLTQREVEWLMEREWARTAEDIVWRRSKLGLRLTSEQIETLDRWMASHLANQPRPAAYV